MVQITKMKLLGDKKIHLVFSDNKEKTIDFTPFIKDDQLSRPLSDQEYFEQVKLYENGRGIFWPNGFDFCPDYLRSYQADDNKVLAK